jgi:LPS export ABC transporter protein LptC
MLKRLLKRQWPLIGLGLLLASVAFFLLRSGRQFIQEPLLSVISSGEGIKLKDIRYAQDDPDKGVKWVLNAREVKFSEDKKSIFFNDFQLNVEPENRPTFRLKGNKGDYSRDTGKINLWGNLEGFSGDGYRILTEHLLINETSGQISTDEPVKIFGPFFSVTGRGLFVDLEEEKLRIQSDVTTFLRQRSLI